MDEETVSTVPDIVVVTDGAGLEIACHYRYLSHAETLYR
jgi:hypothetical protein